MLTINRKVVIFFVNFIILLASFIFLFGKTFAELVQNWMTNDNYSHGFLVIPIVGFMIWQKRDKLSQINLQSNRLGLLVVIIGMFLFFIGNIAVELFTMRFSIIVTIFGLSLFLLGMPFTMQIKVPIAYLLFMIPIPIVIWNKIAFPLQLMVAKITTYVVQIMGIPILREGNILHLPNATLEVVDACSGLRSLTSLLALSGAFAFIVSLRKINKWILFVSAVPIAVIANIIRLTFTAVIARLTGEEAAQGFLHELSGVFIFIVAFVIIYYLYELLSRMEK